MMPRGEVALIIALVGLNSQIVTQATYAIVVFMTAITTLLAPPLLRYLFRQEQRRSQRIERHSTFGGMSNASSRRTRVLSIAPRTNL